MRILRSALARLVRRGRTILEVGGTRAGGEEGGEVVGQDGGMGGEDDRAFDGVAEFADFAGPLVGGEESHGCGGDFGHLGAALAVEVGEEGLGESGDVVEAGAEGGG